MAETASDPKAQADHEHAGGHHAVPVRLLVGVIAALLALTVLTVAVAYVELGEPLNIIVALAIATVKGSLVCAFFMHLYWDKPINTIALLFSIFLLVLFIGLSALDTFQYQDRIQPEFARDAMARERAKLAAAAAAEEEAGEGAGSQEEDEDGLPAEQVDALASFAQNTLGSLPEVAEPSDYELTDAKVDLGRMLYYEERISKARDVSCNTCHPLDEFGVDGLKVSEGHEGQTGEFNAPTVYNAALKTAQFWDGRAADVEEQALKPMTNPVEMGMPSEDEVVERLKGIPGYAPLFEEAFPEAEDPLTIEHVGIAIGAFERRLITPSRFDAFVEGDRDALTPKELRGLQVFQKTNCQMCHLQSLLGGNMQQIFGKMKDWPKEPGSDEPHPDNKTQFHVPQLRNVTQTAPYLHDGSIEDLEVLVQMMAEYQLGTSISDAEAEQLVAFLGSLEGEIPEELIAEPELPE